MIVNASTIIITALVASVAAGPVYSGRGTRVPFRKRNSLKTSEGLFNHDRAIRQIVHDKNKHRNNLLNIEANLGRDFFNEGAEIKPFVPQPKQKRQAEPLAVWGHDIYWNGTIDIGTPAQSFIIDFDTGSADLWVSSTQCKSADCQRMNPYHEDASSTSKAQHGVFRITYGDGSKVSGPTYTDTVAVAGITVTDQIFSAANVVEVISGGGNPDGILGLGFPALSGMGRSPFFSSAIAQGAVKEGVFAFKLTNDESELYLGGTNKSLYTGEIEYHPVVANRGFWQIGNGTLTIGNTTVVSNVQTVIDSGTSLVYGPAGDVERLYQSIPGSKLYDSEYGLYQYPCDAVPLDVSFNWGGQDWTFTADSFNGGNVDGVNCMGAIAVGDMGIGDNTWLVGDSFMKNVYTAFSFDKNSVGFAALK